MHFAPMDGVGALCSYLRCRPDKVAEVVDTVRSIFHDLATTGVAGQELVKAKNKTLSELVIRNELPMGRLGDLGCNWLYLGQYRSIEEDVAAFKAVSVDQVNALIQDLEIGRFTQLSLGPV